MLLAVEFRQWKSTYDPLYCWYDGCCCRCCIGWCRLIGEWLVLLRCWLGDGMRLREVDFFKSCVISFRFDSALRKSIEDLDFSLAVKLFNTCCPLYSACCCCWVCAFTISWCDCCNEIWLDGVDWFNCCWFKSAPLFSWFTGSFWLAFRRFCEFAPYLLGKFDLKKKTKFN